MTARRSKLVCGAVTLSTRWPVGLWREWQGTVGGAEESGAGAPAGFVARTDDLLTVPLRLAESEITTLYNLLRTAWAGGTITWTPDLDAPATTLEVSLESPTPAQPVNLTPDAEYPRLFVVSLTFRKSDGTAFDLPYFVGEPSSPAGPWRPRFAYGSGGASVLRLAFPVGRWSYVLNTAGGQARTATGVAGAWLTEDRSRLVLPIRFLASEWASVRALLAWTRTGAAISWDPDVDNASAPAPMSVYIDAPTAGQNVIPEPDVGNPRVRWLSLLLRRVDGADFTLDYFA